MHAFWSLKIVTLCWENTLTWNSKPSGDVMRMNIICYLLSPCAACVEWENVSSSGICIGSCMWNTWVLAFHEIHENTKEKWILWIRNEQSIMLLTSHFHCRKFCNFLLPTRVHCHFLCFDSIPIESIQIKQTSTINTCVNCRYAMWM